MKKIILIVSLIVFSQYQAKPSETVLMLVPKRLTDSILMMIVMRAAVQQEMDLPALNLC